MPTGKVKWYDKEKGFGFLAAEDGQEVFLPKTSLPAGVTELKAGTRVEFGVADGRRGAQAWDSVSWRRLRPLPRPSA